MPLKVDDYRIYRLIKSHQVHYSFKREHLGTAMAYVPIENDVCENCCTLCPVSCANYMLAKPVIISIFYCSHFIQFYFFSFLYLLRCFIFLL